jgi:hypothetical protein
MLTVSGRRNGAFEVEREGTWWSLEDSIPHRVWKMKKNRLGHCSRVPPAGVQECDADIDAKEAGCPVLFLLF